ncbi:MAG TPA: tetratricopeptide repeat protein [Tepidisphaeraceae bacterium]|jgi:tetratricopeptide (TPR) repeat protein|nr:tetratricopeptide repeat protein [Tepidisphaeraceae bacterium]
MTQDALIHAYAVAADHYKAGRLQQAEDACREIVARAPNQGEPWQLLGTIAADRGQIERAVALFRRASQLSPASAECQRNLARVLKRQNQFDAAISAYRRALQLEPGDAPTHAGFGDLLKAAGREIEALAAYERALAIRPDYGQAYNNYGLLLQRHHRNHEAMAAYQNAMALLPDLPECQVNAASLLQTLGRHEEAIVLLERALSLRPDYALAHNNLGNALRALGRIDEALSRYDRALSLDPALVIALNNRAVTWMQAGQFQRAGDEFRRAIQRDPRLAETHWNYALLLLLLGDFSNGWAEYEWRWRWSGFSEPPRIFSRPLWQGENPAGKAILVHAEQGIGDTIQFVRYARLLAGRGASVIVECQPALVRLLRSAAGVDSVIARGDPLPPYDLHVPSLGLPIRCRTTLQTIPAAVPYIIADPMAVESWRTRLDPANGALRVGIVWAGNPNHVGDHWRSIPVSTLAPLFTMPAVNWYSLQLGAAASQMSAQTGAGRLFDHTADLRDFADTAALLAHLDLIISVDTAAAHLAGAMGKRVWLLLPYVPDWRWLLARADSPWYPTMKLFRQTSVGAWAPVVKAVAGELEQASREHRSPGRFNFS